MKCTFRVPTEESQRALLVLARYACVTKAECINGVVSFVIDRHDPTIEPESGRCAEAMIVRDIQKAVSLHSIEFSSPEWASDE